MRFKNVSDSQLSIGTSFIGSYTTTREHLEKVFGKPSVTYGEGHKVTVEWILEFEDGNVATIYDWKRYEEGTPDWDEVYSWHIGGKTATSVDLIKTALERSC